MDERLRKLKALEESVFILEYELNRVKDMEEDLIIKTSEPLDTNLFMLFKDCDMLRRKLSIISGSFHRRNLDIKNLVKGRADDKK